MTTTSYQAHMLHRLTQQRLHDHAELLRQVREAAAEQRAARRCRWATRAVALLDRVGLGRRAPAERLRVLACDS